MISERRLSEDELRTWKGLRLMFRQLEAHLARELARVSELSMQDYDVLSSVAPLPEHRGAIKALAEHLSWSFSRLSHHLDRMARRSLVRREPAADGVSTDVVVTEEGMAAISAATGAHLTAVRQSFFDRLRSEDLATLERISIEVSGNLPGSAL
ncbi:MarR family transcriptional regulator [Paenarthrobacter sp. PH39-S1]|uniref:MarR family winged helix-turn-helix transcriptional regulator n=1 Tax=Paenarthrobacter sp. PH39-S1 TaxID=3046204 RepID=UPI0024B9EB8B|nr:MarR family transcriptional regulator [Paenarthrobacter sp. PH39-S1]MDJ0356300.1 MarR family transcriptional regulator [Paenarthrobacter sp. PH39-S1]